MTSANGPPTEHRELLDRGLVHRTINTGHTTTAYLDAKTETSRPREALVARQAADALAAHVGTTLVPRRRLPAADLTVIRPKNLEPYFVETLVLRPEDATYCVWGAAEHATVRRDIGPDPIPLVTMTVGMMPHRDDTWTRMHELVAQENKRRHESGPEPVAEPPRPWCAVALHTELLLGLYPDALPWLGDFERTIAWATILKFATDADDLPPKRQTANGHPQ